MSEQDRQRARCERRPSDPRDHIVEVICAEHRVGGGRPDCPELSADRYDDGRKGPRRGEIRIAIPVYDPQLSQMFVNEGRTQQVGVSPGRQLEDANGFMVGRRAQNGSCASGRYSIPSSIR